MAGFDEPIQLYTVDLDTSGITLDEGEPYMSLRDRKIRRVHDRMQRENMLSAAFAGTFETASLFDTNLELIKMRRKFTQIFMLQYREAFRVYVEGNWEEAR